MLTLTQLYPAQPTLSTLCHSPSQFLAVASLGCTGAPVALPVFAWLCLQSHPASQHRSPGWEALAVPPLLQMLLPLPTPSVPPSLLGLRLPDSQPRLHLG